MDKKRIKDGLKVSEDFLYSSDLNKFWMTQNQLKKWISKNYNNFFNEL